MLGATGPAGAGIGFRNLATINKPTARAIRMRTIMNIDFLFKSGFFAAVCRQIYMIILSNASKQPLYLLYFLSTLYLCDL